GHGHNQDSCVFQRVSSPLRFGRPDPAPPRHVGAPGSAPGDFARKSSSYRTGTSSENRSAYTSGMRMLLAALALAIPTTAIAATGGTNWATAVVSPGVVSH